MTKLFFMFMVINSKIQFSLLIF